MKKYLYIAILSALICVLAACAKNPDDTTSQSTAVTTGTDTQNVTPALTDDTGRVHPEGGDAAVSAAPQITSEPGADAKPGTDDTTPSDTGNGDDFGDNDGQKQDAQDSSADEGNEDWDAAVTGTDSGRTDDSGTEHDDEGGSETDKDVISSDSGDEDDEDEDVLNDEDDVPDTEDDNLPDEDDEDDEQNVVQDEEELRKAQLEEAWTETYLMWIPRFTEGVFDATEASDTFDYIIYTDVAKASVLAYIASAEAAGYNTNVTRSDDGTAIAFEASTAEEWHISVAYDNGTLKLGSGFIEDEPEEKDIMAELRASTMLAYVPEFTSGTVSSHYAEGGGEVDYVVIGDVLDEDVRKYVAELKKDGYTIDADEGDFDGIIWYTAMREDGMICDLTFFDGVVKLGCGM